jgi:hypothetical protein
MYGAKGDERPAVFGVPAFWKHKHICNVGSTKRMLIELAMLGWQALGEHPQKHGPDAKQITAKTGIEIINHVNIILRTIRDNLNLFFVLQTNGMPEGVRQWAAALPSRCKLRTSRPSAPSSRRSSKINKDGVI